jgi:hypothetical protein
MKMGVGIQRLSDWIPTFVGMTVAGIGSYASSIKEINHVKTRIRRPR